MRFMDQDNHCEAFNTSQLYIRVFENRHLTYTKASYGYNTLFDSEFTTRPILVPLLSLVGSSNQPFTDPTSEAKRYGDLRKGSIRVDQHRDRNLVRWAGTGLERAWGLRIDPRAISSSALATFSRLFESST